MNVVRRWPILLAGWLAAGVANAAADTLLPDSSVADWSAVVSKINLADESVLFEYTARTFSGSTEGAMLAISFVPRFDCEQTVSFRLPVKFQSEPADVQLAMTLGDATLTFIGLVDDADGFLVFSVGASVDDIAELRNTLDRAPRVSVRVIPDVNNALTRTSQKTFGFSLLGSRLSALAAEESCLSHVPLAYDPQ